MKKYLFAEQKDYIGTARAREGSQWDGPDWYGKDKDGLVMETMTYKNVELCGINLLDKTAQDKGFKDWEESIQMVCNLELTNEEDQDKFLYWFDNDRTKVELEKLKVMKQ